MSTVLTEVAAPGVSVVTLNRPANLNTMNDDLVTSLHEMLTTVASDPSCRVIVLTGAGRGFCSGLDLGGFGSAPDTGQGTGRVQQGRPVQQHITTLIPRLRRLRQPVIAAVNGAASGGGLALALVRRSDRGGVGAVQRGVRSDRAVGVRHRDELVAAAAGRTARAHELMLTGRLFDADEALRIGLVTDVVPTTR